MGSAALLAAQLSQAELLDDRPIAVRRKRRSSSGLQFVKSIKVESDVHQSRAEEEECKNVINLIPETMASSKRVRFSEMSFDELGNDYDAGTASTGLTPAMSHTSFLLGIRSAKPRLLQRPARHYSLPNLSARRQNNSARKLDQSVLHSSLDLDTVDSKEQHDKFSTHKHSEIKDESEDEIEAIRQDLAFAKKQQIHGEADGDFSPSKGYQFIRRLESRLSDLEHSRQPSIKVQQDEEDTKPISVSGTTPSIDCSNKSPLSNRQSPISQSILATDASAQVEIINPTLTTALQDTKVSLGSMFPGEDFTSLHDPNPKQLLDKMIHHLRILKSRLTIAEDDAARMQDQEANLRVQFNAVIQQLDRARKYSEKTSQRAQQAERHSHATATESQRVLTSFTVLKTTCAEKDITNQRLSEAVKSYRVEIAKFESLITQIDKEHHLALAQTRAEKDKALAETKSQMAAAAAESKIAKETIADRDVRIKELLTREKELGHIVTEKQCIIRNTEQLLVDEQNTHQREVGRLNVKIGQLSSELHAALQHQRHATVESTQMLLAKLREEKQAGMRAIAAIQDELAQCTAHTNGIKAAHESDAKRRGADVIEMHGLLTPTTGGRFRNVEEWGGDASVAGHVQLGRGKLGKGRVRHSEGVIVLEEDEDDEDMVMY